MICDQLEIELLLVEAESDFKHLQSRNKEVTEMLVVRRKEIEVLNHDIAKMKKTCLDLRRKVEVQKRDCTEEEKLIQDVFDMRCRDDGHKGGEARSAELEAEITSVTQRLELVHSGNPHIIQEYEKRAQEIERISLRVTNIDGEIAALDEQIRDIRSQWEPQLDELIGEINEAFSYNFEQIKCAGQVSVHKDDEDYAEWAIKIMVKFRYVFV
jgi:structural maintenance of chromosomes protein 5